MGEGGGEMQPEYLNNIQITNLAAQPNNSCILFVYDVDKDGRINNSGNNEPFAYRLNTSDNQGVIEKRIGGDFTDCSTGSWVAISNPKVVDITQLQFVLDDMKTTNNHGGCTHHYKVTTTIAGRLVHNNSITKTIAKTISVRNLQMSSLACGT